MLLSPLPILALLLSLSSTRPISLEFVRGNWGNIASVWGLGVSIYLIFVTTAARKAAQDAKVGEKSRSALEEIKQAADKNSQIAAYAGSASWHAVRIRAEEVMTCCTGTVARWKDDPAFKESSNDLLLVAMQMRSIIQEADKPNTRAASILGLQTTTSNTLSAVVGRITKEQDQRSK